MPISTEADAFVLARPAGRVDVDLDPSVVRQRFEERFGIAATSDLEVRRALLFLRPSLEQVRAQGVVYASALDVQRDEGRRLLCEPTRQVMDGTEVVREVTIETLEGEA